MDDTEEMSSQQRMLQYLRSPDAQNNNNFTWSNLIEKALRTMGGQRTGQEITLFIEHNFKELISGKTKTWRNSVMGCLSSNARKRWVKEQTTVDGKRRYVWNLKEEKPRGAKKAKQSRPMERVYAEDDTDNTLTPASLLGSLSQAQVNSPFAAHTLSKLMRGSPPPPANKKTKLFHEDTDNNIIRSASPIPRQSPVSSPVRPPAGSPQRMKQTQQHQLQAGEKVPSPHSTTPSPSKAPLVLLSRLALLPDANPFEVETVQ